MTRFGVVLVVAFVACGDNNHPRDVAKDAPVDHLRCTPVHGSNITMRPIGQISGIPVLATSPPADPRLFVVMREGTIRIFDNEVLQPEPFIDLSSMIYLEITSERGLLGMAFHPNYATNGQFFVFYTTITNGVVARCTVSPTDRNRANPTCTTVINVLHDDAGNHNGGMIEFGNDGLLYIGTGDGGGHGDPAHRAQDLNQLRGKILRIDVDNKAPGMEYGIPPTNPYAAGGGRPEIFILGVRNPWRWSFDRATGDMWIGDVGQARYEEMTVLRPSQQTGANLGWSIYEGPGCCDTQSDHCTQTIGNTVACDPTGITFPQDIRDRTTPRGERWASIITGQTYRGSCYPDIIGYHFYTDCYAGVLVKARLLADDTLEMTDYNGIVQAGLGVGPSSLHADSRGELYLTDVSGTIFHLEAGP